MTSRNSSAKRWTPCKDSAVAGTSRRLVFQNFWYPRSSRVATSPTTRKPGRCLHRTAVWGSFFSDSLGSPALARTAPAPYLLTRNWFATPGTPCTSNPRVLRVLKTSSKLRKCTFVRMVATDCGLPRFSDGSYTKDCYTLLSHIDARRRNVTRPVESGTLHAN